jgi:TolA-binding protein
MTIGNSSRPSGIVWLAIAALLVGPVSARAHRLTNTNLEAADSLEDPQEIQDKEQERRDREQEARDREQERRDREEEARDRAQERLDRLQELYDDGREALDEDRYDQAESKFKQLADMGGPQTDAALYWKWHWPRLRT